MPLSYQLPQYNTPYWQKQLRQPSQIGLELGLVQWGDFTSDDEDKRVYNEKERAETMRDIIQHQIEECEARKKSMYGVCVLFQMLSRFPKEITLDMYDSLCGMIHQFPVKYQEHLDKIARLKELKKACYDTFSPTAFESLKPSIKEVIKCETQNEEYYKTLHEYFHVVKARLLELEPFVIKQEKID
jgi:hypothetical protein